MLNRRGKQCQFESAGLQSREEMYCNSTLNLWTSAPLLDESCSVAKTRNRNQFGACHNEGAFPGYWKALWQRGGVRKAQRFAMSSNISTFGDMKRRRENS